MQIAKDKAMESIVLKCPAKINLSLDILGKRSDGYHEINTVMQTISLEDKVTISKAIGFSISIKGAHLPTDDNNIAMKTAKIMFETFGISNGVDIHIEKHIPVAAGLAGGSTDAAGVIQGIDKLFELNLTKKQMFDIGRQVGSDVPYLIQKGTALCTGRGDIIKPLKTLIGFNVLIAKPRISVSTKEVYDNLKLNLINKRPNNDVILKCIEENNIQLLAQNLVNVLETVTIPIHKEIEDIKKIMMEHGALGALMSGSGPTVFGIFREENTKQCYDYLKSKLDEVYIAQML
ncbi:MAG: 4-(cytidine 5'-diphospho)-2-C-methyl-D-erythritol kinase [Clostridium sp.]